MTQDTDPTSGPEHHDTSPQRRLRDAIQSALIRAANGNNSEDALNYAQALSLLKEADLI